MWIEKANSLQATFVFVDFKVAFSFMCEVAFEAEKMDHHPKWTNIWNTVNFELNTHSAGNTVTELDHKLAAIIDTIALKHQKH
jgi:4a-hydroxytetrahydrobiopterin dehydratase